MLADLGYVCKRANVLAIFFEPEQDLVDVPALLMDCGAQNLDALG